MTDREKIVEIMARAAAFARYCETENPDDDLCDFCQNSNETECLEVGSDFDFGVDKDCCEAALKALEEAGYEIRDAAKNCSTCGLMIDGSERHVVYQESEKLYHFDCDPQAAQGEER